MVDFNSQLLASRGFKARPLKDLDAAFLHGLLRQSAEETGASAPPIEGITQILNRLGERLRTDSLVILSETDEPLAAALVFLPPASGDNDVASLLGVVRPDHYQQGIGTSLLDWMERRVCRAHETDDSLRFMRMSCDPNNQARVRLFKQHGFTPVRYSFKMEKTLSSSIDEPAIPSELSLLPWSDEWHETARKAFNQAFEGHWGLPTIDAEMWMSRFVGVPQFRTDLSWLVIHGSEVVGLCVNWVPPGNAYGWIEAIGVVPAWRSRGIADAMMARALNAFLDNGLTKVALDVDSGNLTGALQLYEKVGFAAVKREAIFTKPIG